MSTADHAAATRRNDPAPKFPTLKSAEAYRMRFERARRLMVDGKLAPVEEASVIDITTDGDWPAMGTGLALFVEGTAIVESEQLAPRRYRFIAPPDVEWKGGSSLALGLAGSGVPKPLSSSQLKLPALDPRSAVRRE